MEGLDRLVEDTLQFLEQSGKLGDRGEPARSPSFARAEQALDEQIGQASEEIWKASVETRIEAFVSAASLGAVRAFSCTHHARSRGVSVVTFGSKLGASV